MVLRHARRYEVVVKERIEQIRLAAPPNTSNHFYQAIVFSRYELAQIQVTFNFHGVLLILEVISATIYIFRFYYSGLLCRTQE